MAEPYRDDFDRIVESLSDIRKSPCGRDAQVTVGPVTVTVTVELGDRAINRLTGPLLDAVHHHITRVVTLEEVQVLQTSRGNIVVLELPPLQVVARVGSEGWRAALREQAYTLIRAWLHFDDPATIISWLPFSY